MDESRYMKLFGETLDHFLSDDLVIGHPGVHDNLWNNMIVFKREARIHFLAKLREVGNGSTPATTNTTLAPDEQWSERWYGSGGAEGHEGWSITSHRHRNLIAYLGRDISAEEVRKIVDAHNAAIGLSR